MLRLPRFGRFSAGFATLLVLGSPPLLAGTESGGAAPSTAKPAPIVRKKATGSLTVPFLSPSERTEETLTVQIEPILDGSRLRDGTGKPVIEKKLTLPPRPRRVRVTFDDLSAGRWLLSWSGPGLAGGEKSFTVAASPVEGSEVVLRAGMTLQGSVRDDLGMVLPDVEVRIGPAHEAYVDSPLPSRTARSGPDGTFTLTGAPVGAKLTWEAKAEGHVPATGLVGGETRLEVVLERAQRVTGRVFGPDGKPVGGAGLHPRYLRKDENGLGRELRSHAGSIRTDEMGRFAFHRAFPWPGNVAVRARGLLTETVPLEAISSFGEPRELDLGTITLGKGRRVSGRVVTAKEGEPVPGARAQATWLVRDGETRIQEATEAPCAPDGSFELTGLPESGDVRLVALAPAFPPRAVALASEATSVEIRLGKGGRVEGEVCGTPAEIARTWVWHGSEAREHSGPNGNEIEVDSSGRFVVEGAETGPWTFSRAWKFRDATGAMRGGIGGVTSASARVTVEEGATARVRLACDGIPVSGVLMANGAPLGDRVLVLTKDSRVFGEGFVDAATGRFTVRVPAPGRYESWGSMPPKGTAFASPGCDVPPEGLYGCVIDLTLVAN